MLRRSRLFQASPVLRGLHLHAHDKKILLKVFELPSEARRRELDRITRSAVLMDVPLRFLGYRGTESPLEV